MPVASRHSPSSSDDPFDDVLKPPPNETPEQRESRLAREAQAKRVSLAIDESIKAEKQLRKKKRVVRLLLLGQSESGKSTTLRQFQRLYTPSAFREERILWRAVIQLNLIRSVRTILEAISSRSPHNRSASTYHPRTLANHQSRTRRATIAATDLSHGHKPPPFPVVPATEFDLADADNRYETRIENGQEESDDENETDTSHLPHELEDLKMRLLPLQHIEALLMAKLVPPNEDEATVLGGASGSNSISSVEGSGHGHEDNSSSWQSHNAVGKRPSWRNQEVFVRPGTRWKGVLAKTARAHERPLSAGTTGLETIDEPQHVLHECRRDIMTLWGDPGVREILKRRKIRLEEFPGFFLNDLERVTSLRYMPTDDDVLKARLKTVGVSEYKFEMEVAAGKDTGTEWRIVDVGGSRSQVTKWMPYFDDVDAILFLAPISGFDQVLSEDRTVNRLEDSVLLWKDICSNKLLANVELVLFLNKCDILEAKLKSGVRLAKYVRSYGDRGNDVESVSKYLRGKFSAIHREYSPNPRKFYVFLTSVTDTATTAGIIASVRDTVVRQHLKQSKLL